MELRIVTVGELRAFVEEPAFALLPNIPISPLRAISQEQNPNSEVADPALVIAYDPNGEILAYFGCLPDQLNKESPLENTKEVPAPTLVLKGIQPATKPEKVCWSSCWWVHPTKGQGSSMPVFYKALQLWNAKMLFDALPETSLAVLERMGYFSFRKMDGIHAFLRFKLHKIIPSRIPFLAPLKNIFFVLDSLLNIFVTAWLAFQKSNNSLPPEIKVQQISSIDQHTEKLIKSLAGNDLIQRETSTFNWIINTPWLSKNKEHTKSYYFSSHAFHFENILLNISEKGTPIAFLWLTLRDGTLKLPYCYIKTGKENIAAKILTQQSTALKADTFICFQQNILPALAKNKMPFLYKKEVSKTFAWTKTLDTSFESTPYIQDGDGDGVFT